MTTLQHRHGCKHRILHDITSTSARETFEDVTESWWFVVCFVVCRQSKSSNNAPSNLTLSVHQYKWMLCNNHMSWEIDYHRHTRDGDWGLRMEKVSMQIIFHWGFHIISNLNHCPQLSPILSRHQETFDNAYATSLHQALCPQYSMKKGNEKNGELANFAIFSSFNINLLTCNINTDLNHWQQLFSSINTTRSHPTILCLT